MSVIDKFLNKRKKLPHTKLELNTSKHRLSEMFGFPDGEYEKSVKELSTILFKLTVIGDGTKTEALEKYLEQMGKEYDTYEEHFVLGMIFIQAVELIHRYLAEHKHPHEQASTKPMDIIDQALDELKKTLEKAGGKVEISKEVHGLGEEEKEPDAFFKMPLNKKNKKKVLN
jgi:hypothetical protein